MGETRVGSQHRARNFSRLLGDNADGTVRHPPSPTIRFVVRERALPRRTLHQRPRLLEVHDAHHANAGISPGESAAGAAGVHCRGRLCHAHLRGLETFGGPAGTRPSCGRGAARQCDLRPAAQACSACKPERRGDFFHGGVLRKFRITPTGIGRPLTFARGHQTFLTPVLPAPRVLGCRIYVAQPIWIPPRARPFLAVWFSFMEGIKCQPKSLPW